MGQGYLYERWWTPVASRPSVVELCGNQPPCLVEYAGMDQGLSADEARSLRLAQMEYTATLR